MLRGRRFFNRVRFSGIVRKGCRETGSGPKTLLFKMCSGQIQNIESLETVLCLLGVEISGLEGLWGVNYSAEACSHCVKVCLVVLLLKRELDSLLECLRW
jgi:hypothetical protein